MIEVIINEEVKKVDLEGKERIRGFELLKKLGLNTEEYLILKDGVLVPISDYIEAGSKVELLPVISGG